MNTGTDVNGTALNSDSPQIMLPATPAYGSMGSERRQVIPGMIGASAEVLHRAGGAPRQCGGARTIDISLRPAAASWHNRMDLDRAAPRQSGSHSYRVREIGRCDKEGGIVRARCGRSNRIVRSLDRR